MATPKVQEKVMVEVKDAPSSAPATAVTVAEGGTAGLTPQEIEMGKATGVLTEEKPAEKKPTDEGQKPETDSTKTEEEEAEGEEKTEEKPATKEEKKAAEEEAFDDPEKEFALVKTYNPNEKALYFKQKKERLKRQTAERERDFLKTQNEALRRDAAAKKKPVDADAELDADLEDLDADPAAKDKDKPLTMADLEARDKAKLEADKKARSDAKVISDRLDLLNQEASAKYDDFNEVMDLANEVMKKDKYGVYAMKLSIEAADPDGNVAEYAYSLGKLHPNYGKHRKAKKDAAPDAGATKTNVEKIVDNAQKRTSSAALGGGSEKGRLVSEDDLTLADVSGMSQSAWDKLSSKTRDRLMRS